MAWPNVQLSDLVDRWELPPEKTATATTRLEDAEAELRRELRLHGITGTPSFGTTEEERDWERLFTATVVESVRRYLVNTEGWVEETEALDDFRLTRRRSNNASTGLVFVDEDQVLKLLPDVARRARRRGAFNIHLGQS